MRVFSAIVVSFVAVSSFADDIDGSLRMNQIQIIATHNSYHQAPPNAKPPEPGKEVSRATQLRFQNHAPLLVQLDRGVRGFELDLYWQGDGTFQVMHVPIYDPGTSCETIEICATQIREWSKANPRHVPIIVHMEVKDDRRRKESKYNRPVNKAEIDVLDQTLAEVFPAAQIFTPDDLKGDFATPNEAATSGGWPTIDDVRGQVVFILHNRGVHREQYLLGNPTAEGRAIFNFAVPGEPDAAFLIRDNPDDPELPKLVAEGYMIRTRGGAPTDEGRFERAMASGGHLVSTDNPPGEPDEETGFVATFGDGKTIRKNPIAK